MRPHLRWIPISLVLLATLGATPAAPPAGRTPARAGAASGAAGDAAARKTIERVAAHYRSLASYRLEGQASVEVGSDGQMNNTVTSVRFLVRRPHHFASEVRSTEMDTRMVTDGESLWTAVPPLSQYQVQSVAALRAGKDSSALARQIDPAAEYARLLEGVTRVRALGRDTVHTGRGVVACERYALTRADAAGAAQDVTMSPRVVWVDPATRMVLLDSMRAEQKHPQLGTVRSVNLTRMVIAEANPSFAADAFTFRPGSDLRRVRRFARTSPEHAELEGKPASDFTLETLAEGKPVRLSELKGKVVLLDFWATWCGPCRRWMPIVAKARRDYADQGLVVYAVNEREPEAKVREYLDKQKIDVPVLMDRTGSVGGMFRASSIPLTVLVGRDGQVVRVLVGLHGEDDLRDALLEAGLD